MFPSGEPAETSSSGTSGGGEGIGPAALLRPEAIDVVVFDYGGVLTTPVSDSIRSWLERDGIDPASFSRTLKTWLSRSAPEGTPIHRLETGELSIGDFDRLLAAELLATTGGPVSPVGLVRGLFADLRPDPAMFGLAEDIRRCGVRVALLSNSWGNPYPRDRIDAIFSPVVISGEVGMRKPNADIFRYTLNLLGTTPARVVFVDDAEPNTDGASRLGLHTVLHIDSDTTRRALTGFVPGLLSHHQLTEEKS
ncbi:MAG: HAD family hydrolase [Candidatus Dormibacteria bacterium]